MRKRDPRESQNIPAHCRQATARDELVFHYLGCLVVIEYIKLIGTSQNIIMGGAKGVITPNQLNSPRGA